MRGAIIAFEGIDGSGKTLQSKRLAAFLKDKKYDTSWLRQPSDGRWGRKIRSLISDPNRVPVPMADMTMFILDRADQHAEQIESMLVHNMVVVLDRSYVSSAIYQAGGKLSSGDIIAANEAAVPRPDLVILLDLDAELAMERIASSGRTEQQCFEKLHILKGFRSSYLYVLPAHKFQYVVIDASMDPDEVSQAVNEKVLAYLQENN